MEKSNAAVTAKKILHGGGMMRLSGAIRAGILSQAFYALRDSSTLVQIPRGLYRLEKMESISEPDRVVVSSKP